MQQIKPKLKLDWCSYEAAKYACEKFHYSKSIPAGKLIKIGVWEDEKFIGSIIYGRGANNNAHKYFKVDMTECCELTRVALTKHVHEVSKMLAISLKLLKKLCPKLKLVFSYADKTNQGHSGAIYKASNWVYLGERTTGKGAHYIINGKKIHGRSARAKYGNERNFPKNWQNCDPETKHLFVYYLACKKGLV